jgi:hypothetical protein
MPQQNYVVPNVTFAEPYAQYPQPQQIMAIIGGYAVRNMQDVAAIQSNAAQHGEGNANIAYELGRLCRMDLPGPTTSVGTRTDYSVGPWDYPTCVAQYLLA